MVRSSFDDAETQRFALAGLMNVCRHADSVARITALEELPPRAAQGAWPRRTRPQQAGQGAASTRGACRPQRRSAPRRSCVRSTRTSPRTARPADMCRAAGRPPLPRRPHAQAAHGPVRVKGTVTTVFTCSSFQFVLHVLSKPKVVHGHVHGSSPDLDSPSGRLCPEG